MSENIQINQNGSSQSALKIEIKEYEADPFYRNIRQHVEKMIIGLEQGATKTLKKICDKEFWKELEKGQRIAAGSYVALLVAAEQLPLELKGKDGANACLYQVKSL